MKRATATSNTVNDSVMLAAELRRITASNLRSKKPLFGTNSLQRKCVPKVPHSTTSFVPNILCANLPGQVVRVGSGQHDLHARTLIEVRAGQLVDVDVHLVLGKVDQHQVLAVRLQRAATHKCV